MTMNNEENESDHENDNENNEGNDDEYVSEFQLIFLNKITRKDNAQEMKGYGTKQRFIISMMQQIKY